MPLDPAVGEHANSPSKALKQGRTNASERACLPLNTGMGALSPIPVRQSMNRCRLLLPVTGVTSV